MYDLHVHSYYSDGKLSPRRIAEEAKALGLHGLALSDHDTIEGLEQMDHYGKKCGLDIIPAVEFGTTWETEGNMVEIHILGYLMDTNDAELQNTLNALTKARRERIITVVDILRDFGLDISAEEVFAKKKRGIVGRGHVSQVLVEKQYVQNAGEAFDRFLGAGKFAYVPKTVLQYDEIIRLIHKTGGVAICAHPKTMKNDAILEDLRRADIDGIEVINAKHQIRDVHRYLSYVLEHKELIATAGSDCHGRTRKNGALYLGRYASNHKTIQALRERAAERRSQQ
jgi:predicted metal-dependent phosphoesterase TrpH